MPLLLSHWGNLHKYSSNCVVQKDGKWYQLKEIHSFIHFPFPTSSWDQGWNKTIKNKNEIFLGYKRKNKTRYWHLMDRWIYSHLHLPSLTHIQPGSPGSEDWLCRWIRPWAEPHGRTNHSLRWQCSTTPGTHCHSPTCRSSGTGWCSCNPPRHLEDKAHIKPKLPGRPRRKEDANPELELALQTISSTQLVTPGEPS